MDRDDLMALMIATPAPVPDFGDWARVIAIYAGYLEKIAPKLDAAELGELVGAGAMFYRTLCQAEAYRSESVMYRSKERP